MTQGTSVEACASASANLRPKRGGFTAREMPADFHIMAAKLTPFHLRKFYACSGKATARWYKESGITPLETVRPGPRPVPADFAEQCAKLTQRELRVHYQIGAEAIRRLLTESGHRPAQAPVPPPRTGAPVPDDFAAVAPQKTRSALAAHYETSTNIIDRWLKKVGVRPVADTRSTFRQALLPPVDGSVAAQAAQHLRRFRSTVFKADILPRAERAKYGLSDGKGFYVVAGCKGAVPAADLIAMAEAKGFNARAWAQI